MTVESVLQHTVHPRYITAASQVIDLGANCGAFAQRIVERFGCACIAVEPAPDLFADIPDGPKLRKLQLAIAGENGEIELQLSERSTANSIFKRSGVHQDAVRVPCRTLDTFLADLGWEHVDLLKVDIEGAEIDMFMGCSDEALKGVGQITVEFHDFIGLSTEAEVGAVLERLAGLGFRSIRMSRKHNKDVWLINQPMTGISDGELWRIEHMVRPWNHFLRRVGLKKRDKSGRSRRRLSHA